MVLAAVAGGLRDLLLARGEPVGDLVLRASVPVSLHQEQSGRPLGNQVGWMAVPLPVGEPVKPAGTPSLLMHSRSSEAVNLTGSRDRTRTYNLPVNRRSVTAGSARGCQ